LLTAGTIDRDEQHDESDDDHAERAEGDGFRIFFSRASFSRA
jgi:hypothetical protein